MFYQKADTIDMINIYMHNIPLESELHSQYYAYIRLAMKNLMIHRKFHTIHILPYRHIEFLVICL